MGDILPQKSGNDFFGVVYAAKHSLKESFDLVPDVCACCGLELTGIDLAPYRHQVTEIPPVVAQVNEYRLHTLTCQQCGVETRAELPAGVPQGGFGPRMQAMVSLSSGHYHLSKRKTRELMADFFQADISFSSVPTLEQRTSELLAEPVTEAHEYVKQQAVVHIDETGWKQVAQRAWAMGRRHHMGECVLGPPSTQRSGGQGDTGRLFPGHHQFRPLVSLQLAQDCVASIVLGTPAA